MLRIRLIMAAVGLPLALGVCWYGGWLLELFVVALALIAFLEYAGMMKVGGFRMMPFLGLGTLAVLLFAFPHGWDVGLCCFGVLFVTVLYSVRVYPSYTLQDIVYSFFGSAYIGFLFSYGIWMGYQPDHFLYLVLVMFLAWGNDSGGYIFGRLFGKDKLAPKLSPKKTIAGSIGGVAFSTMLLIILNICLSDPLPWLPLLLLCILGSAGSQAGDLFASLMKRFFDVKDAGKIFPGHGGVLDRFDSFLVVLPIVYYFIQFAVQ